MVIGYGKKYSWYEMLYSLELWHNNIKVAGFIYLFIYLLLLFFILELLISNFERNGIIIFCAY